LGLTAADGWVVVRQTVRRFTVDEVDGDGVFDDVHGDFDRSHFALCAR
jgi:hypothetical protein